MNCHNLTACLFTTFAQESKKSTGQRHPNTSDKKKLPYKVFIHENANNHWCIVCQKAAWIKSSSKLLPNYFKTRFWSSKLPYTCLPNKGTRGRFFLKLEIPTGIWSEKTNMPYVFVRENSIKYWCTIQGLNHNEVLRITSHSSLEIFCCKDFYSNGT